MSKRSANLDDLKLQRLIANVGISVRELEGSTARDLLELYDRLEYAG